MAFVLRPNFPWAAPSQWRGAQQGYSVVPISGRHETPLISDFGLKTPWSPCWNLLRQHHCHGHFLPSLLHSHYGLKLLPTLSSSLTFYLKEVFLLIIHLHVLFHLGIYFLEEPYKWYQNWSEQKSSKIGIWDWLIHRWAGKEVIILASQWGMDSLWHNVSAQLLKISLLITWENVLVEQNAMADVIM